MGREPIIARLSSPPPHISPRGQCPPLRGRGCEVPCSHTLLGQVLDHTINDEQRVGICSVDVKDDIQNVRRSIQEAEDYAGKCVDVLVNCAGILSRTKDIQCFTNLIIYISSFLIIVSVMKTLRLVHWDCMHDIYVI